jgi:hypothetical protein
MDRLRLLLDALHVLAKQFDPEHPPGRSEAIRRLVELGLKVKK